MLILLALAGCDRPSAVETRERASADAPMALASTPEAAGAENRGAAAPKPVLTANRRETTDAKVARLFERNGAAFDARTPDDYLAKVEAFTAKPPRDVETVKRPNGDTLIYQASTNTFAVVARDGTPRTMFKPTTGAAYWAEQKASAPTFGRRRQSTDAAGRRPPPPPSAAAANRRTPPADIEGGFQTPGFRPWPPTRPRR